LFCVIFSFQAHESFVLMPMHYLSSADFCQRKTMITKEILIAQRIMNIRGSMVDLKTMTCSPLSQKQKNKIAQLDVMLFECDRQRVSEFRELGC